MKKLILMLAICGASVALPAQTNERSVKAKTHTENKHSQSKTSQNKTSHSGMTVTSYPQQEPADKSDAKIPEKVSNNFKKAYPGISPKWLKEGACYKAVYHTGRASDKVESVVVYDQNAKIVHTEARVKYKNYPVAIVKYYEKKYPGSDYKVWEIDKPDGEKKYYGLYNNEKIWFDKEGNVIRNNEYHASGHTKHSSHKYK